MRAAWAVVILDRDRQAAGHALGPASALAGPLTGDLQSIPLAELTSVLMALRMASCAADLVIHCDCEYVCKGVHGVVRGPADAQQEARLDLGRHRVHRRGQDDHHQYR
jgi:ribonuclease HI